MTDPYGATRRNGPERFRASADDRLEEPEPWRDPLSALAEQENRLREFVRCHPLPVVAGALVLGFVLARAMREA